LTEVSGKAQQKSAQRWRKYEAVTSEWWILTQATTRSSNSLVMDFYFVYGEMKDSESWMYQWSDRVGGRLITGDRRERHAFREFPTWSREVVNGEEKVRKEMMDLLCELRGSDGKMRWNRPHIVFWRKWMKCRISREDYKRRTEVCIFQILSHPAIWTIFFSWLNCLFRGIEWFPSDLRSPGGLQLKRLFHAILYALFTFG
jgi:hypothetical protein